MFTSVGEIAKKTETPICFFIDEIQYMKQEELGALIAALHRSNQLGYPIMIVGAGLPKIYKMLSEEKSYSERLFMYKEIGSLSVEQSKKAIEIPAEQFEVSYTPEAVDNGFFKVRYERCAESDKKFVFAMVRCGELPCTISNVAQNLNKDVTAISTTRAQLINKGIIYPIRYKELDFTVPEFSGFIQRLDEYQMWCDEKK